MPRLLCSLGMIAFPLLLAGCSLDGVGQAGSFTGSGTSQDHSGSSAGSANPSTSGGQPDSLEERFPGCQEPTDADGWRDRVFELLNNQRVQNGVAPLSRNEVLDAEAEQYACEMIYYDFFAHVNPVTGSDLAARATDFGYDYWMIGENLAAGQTSPEQVVTDWMNSPGHRENMLQKEFTEVGVGLRQGGDYGLYWVLEFGEPQ